MLSERQIDDRFEQTVALTRRRSIRNVGKCEARHISDQKVCNKCGICWDVNDPDPPKCRIK